MKNNEARNTCERIKNNKETNDFLINNYEHCRYKCERITKNGTLLKGFELHHIKRIVDGGTNDLDNLIWIPSAVHRILKDKECVYNTRRKVLEFCNEYITNETQMTSEEFSQWFETMTYNKKKWMKKYREINYEKLSKNAKEYYQNNKEEKKEYTRKYKKKNRNTEKFKIWDARDKNKRRMKKQDKSLAVRMNCLYKYQIVVNPNDTKNSLWRWDEENKRIIWLLKPKRPNKRDEMGKFI